MAKVKDMTEKQFFAALTRHGAKWTGLMGYVEFADGVFISCLNAGKGLRAKLAYLLKEHDRIVWNKAHNRI